MRFLLAVLVFWLASPRDAFSAPKELRPPPVGDTILVKVMRGGTADVTLKAFEGRGNPLAYDIASPPSHGELQQFRQADENRQGFASVVYAHGNDEESIADEFTFKARALIGGGASSPIKVKVQIVDAPPRLQTTPVVDFSAVAGESDLQQIVLANKGGGLLEGLIDPKEPFHVQGEGRFSLGRGQMTNIIVRFSPQAAEGLPAQKISPAPADPGVTVTLRGEAKVPFTAAADSLQVRPDGTRSGTIVISNLSYSPISIGLALASDRVAEIPARAEIPGQGSAEIPLKIGSDKAGGAGEIRVVLSNPFHQQDLTVAVPAVPPRLEVITPELDFRTGKETVLAVKNAGGIEGRVSVELELSGTLKSIEGAQTFAVEPGAVREIPLRHEKKKGASNPEVLIVDLGKAGKVPVPLLFAPPEPSPSPTPPTAASSPSPAPQTTPWDLNRDVKLETGEGRAFIAWSQTNDLWINAILETVTAGGSTPYESAREDTNWWETVKAWLNGRAQEPRQEKRRFSGDRPTVPGEKATEAAGTETSESPWRREAIADRDARGADSCWRITAEKKSNGIREQVSADFEIDWQNRKLVPVRGKLVVQEESPQQASQTLREEKASPGKLQIPRSPARALRKIQNAKVVAERTRATVNLTVEEDPAVTGFRLERGEIVFAADQKNGIPAIPEFAPVPHNGKVTISATAAAEHEGKKLTVVVAEIDGLQPGTATLWRLVPLSGGGFLAPTAEFLVATAPPWLFPWRGFFLCLMAAILAAVLWLRNRQRRAEYR